MKNYIVLLLSIFVIVNFVQAKNRGDFCGTAQALQDFQTGKLPIRPTLTGPEQFIDRPLFRVHYTLQGNDAVTVAYAESVASYVSYCWAIEVDSLGWVAPPPDNGQGGDNRYDFYIRLLSSGVMGTTYAENSYTNPYPNGVTSYIALSNVYSGNDLKVTIAHEFCHACEFRYSSVEGTWWMENCATWMEDLVYDDVNYYTGYLMSSPNPLSNPNLAITNGTGLYWYAGAIWAMFLGDCYGNDCLRQIWTYQGQISGQNALSGIDYILTNQYSSNLVTALKQYAVWRYFTGSRADTIHFFKEGYLYPLVYTTATHNSYPVSGSQLSYSLSNPGGAGYIQFLNGGGKIFLNFNAQSIYRWGCFVVGYRSNNLSTVAELTLNSSAAGSDSFNWQSNEHFALIPVANQWEYNTGALGYSYSADLRILHDVGVVSLTGFATIVDSGAVVNPQALVKNWGLSADSFSVRLTIGNNYSNTQNLSLNPLDSSLVTFPPCTLKVRNYNAILCTTLLATDERLTNNSISNRVYVRVKDVGVTAIIEPVGNIVQGTSIHPQAHIKNYGNMREMFSAGFSIGNWQCTQNFTLAAGFESDLTFDSIWQPSDTGNFVVKCSTRLTSDVNENNNLAAGFCRVILSAISETNTSLLNKPRVVINNKKIIIYGIANSNPYELEIFDIQGRSIFSKKSIETVIDLDKPLSTGCYIVRLKTDNKYLVYKSVIIKR